MDSILAFLRDLRDFTCSALEEERERTSLYINNVLLQMVTPIYWYKSKQFSIESASTGIEIMADSWLWISRNLRGSELACLYWSGKWEPGYRRKMKVCNKNFNILNFLVSEIKGCGKISEICSICWGDIQVLKIILRNITLWRKGKNSSQPCNNIFMAV